MSRTDDHIHEHAPQRLVVRVTDNDFQREVLDKLGRLEVKMDMLVGGAQPGRMQLAENRLSELERSDIFSECGYHYRDQCANHYA